MDGLSVKWSKMERDLVFAHDRHSWDGQLLYSALCCRPIADSAGLVQELDKRGFDVTTLRFSIKRKK